jgi:hypothetical protein
MQCVPDNAIGALTKLLGDIVSLVNDKFLVEDLEHLAVLQVTHGCVWRGACGAVEQRRLQSAVRLFVVDVERT